MDDLTRESPAKINLTLRILGRRPDGYHEIESLVTRVTLSDTVTVTPRREMRWTLECSEPGVPRDHRNLALRAVARLAEAVGVRRGVHIAIEKRIPAGAGLGGGSSNAAAVLMLLNELWELPLSVQELAQIGARVGSDVPLFFHAPLCILRGRGEQIEDVDRPFRTAITLFLPQMPSSTRLVYETWDRLRAHPSRPPLPELFVQLEQPDALNAHLFNDLEPAAFAAYPALAMLHRRLEEVCDRAVRLTGSGSGLYCLGAIKPGVLAAVTSWADAEIGPIRIQPVLAAH